MLRYYQTLQTHHVYSTLKRRGNNRFYVVSTWNTRGVFVGVLCFCYIIRYFDVIMFAIVVSFRYIIF